jgi:rod shape-determining protein MreD
VIWFDLRQRAAKLARLSVPALCTLLLLLITILPWWPFGEPMAGVLTLASIFFWGLYRPVAMPAWLATLIGFASDLIGVTPLGVGTLSALITRGLAGWRQRDLARASTLAVWGAFAATMAATGVLAWLLAGVANAGWYDFRAALTQPAVAIVAYPFLSYLLAKADRAVFKP